MAFTPVDLVHADGSEWTARTPVELNDLTARGFQRVEVAEKTVTPSPVPRHVDPVHTWNAESPAAGDE